jgi:ubiquinone/menaquinone biosynthesis C-methylase UbiE/predicted transcriptional regulator
MSGKEKSIDLQPELILNIHWGLAKAQTLQTAVEIGIFSFIKEGQTTVEKMAKSLGTTHRAARIFLDALVGMGLLAKARGAYKLTPESKTFLVKGEAQYLGNFILGTKGSTEKWNQLTEVVKSGKPTPTMQSSENRDQFFKGLVKGIFSTSFASGVILGKKLGVGKSLQGSKILDLGCGAAPWSLALAVADPSSQVVGIDFPPILEVAQSYIKRFHSTKQFELRPGDFHEVPFERETYDLVILGHILHGEGEAGSKKLIKRSYEALKPGGKILISEFVANDLKSGPEIPLLFALNMLLFTEHGDVYTIKDLKRWLSLAGFKKTSAQAVQYPVTVMVGTK